jgi:quercetin dioxygenase-like cupin family protein
VRIALLACLAVAAAGCAARPPAQVLSTPPPRARPLDAAAPPLADGENIRPTEIARGEHASLALVRIRDRETPHVHTRYDLTVTLVEGHGTLWLAGAPLPMRPGDVAFVPRGTPHWFVNDAATPAAALVSFAPAYSGPDSAPAPEPRADP